MAEEPPAGRYALLADVEDRRVRSVEQVQSVGPGNDRLAQVTAMARAIFGVPMAAVSLIDRSRQLFLHADGIELGESLPRENTVCQAVIARSYAGQGDPALVLDDAAAGVVEYVDAGHGLGVLLYTDGRIEQLPHDGLPIGVLPNQTWTSRRVRLDPELCATVRALAGSRHPLDDVTLVVIHREPG